jgi:hypothetical protein
MILVRQKDQEDHGYQSDEPRACCVLTDHEDRNIPDINVQDVVGLIIPLHPDEQG